MISFLVDLLAIRAEIVMAQCQDYSRPLDVSEAVT
jgi:hypothetical protein